ncbi:MAG: LolA family protein [Bacteroidales bacterium]
MLKSILITAGTILFLFPLAVAAQQDPQAKAILDRMGEKMEQYGTIHVRFSVTTTDRQSGTEETREGELTVKKEKYLLNFLDTESYFDGETLWSYLPDVKEVSVTEPDPDESFFFSNPARLFSGYDKEYKYLYLGTDPETGHEIIDLVPMELNREYSRIRITVDPSSYHISTAYYYGKDGIHHLLRIKSLEDADVPDSFFIFDPSKHPDVEVIDMRF